MKIPNRILEDDKFKEEVENIWNSVSGDGALARLDKALLASSCFFRDKTYQQAVITERKENNSRRVLKALQHLWELHPACGWIKERMEHAKAKVIDAKIQKDEFRFHRKKTL